MTVIGQYIHLFGVEGDTGIGRECPRGGRPDDKSRLLMDIQLLFGCITQLEVYIDGVVLFVLILHLRVRQCRLCRPGPEDRLVTLDQQSALCHFTKRAIDIRFELEVHRHIRVLPVGDDTQRLEALSLDIDELRRMGTAEFSELLRRHRLFLGLAKLLFNLLLDRQTMAVPARCHAYRFALKVVVLEDDIFEDLVERMSDMDVTVGIRRTVMQSEHLRTFTLGFHLFIDIGIKPYFVLLGLVCREVSTHREVCFGEEEGLFVIHR